MPSDGGADRDRLVKEAAEKITRFDPPEACSACEADAIIVDIRSQDARKLHGVVPGSLHEAWRDAGLPVAPCRPPLVTAGGLPGTGPPESPVRGEDRVAAAD